MTTEPLFSGYCFNTQPPEGGWEMLLIHLCQPNCFNTQPPEGGWPLRHVRILLASGFNTQPPEGGWKKINPPKLERILFQHTAARRRLGRKR